jgi:hypothetical protein
VGPGLGYFLSPSVRTLRLQLGHDYGTSWSPAPGTDGDVELTVANDSTTGGDKLGEDCSSRQSVLQPVTDHREATNTMERLSFGSSNGMFGWTLVVELMSPTVPTLPIHRRLFLSKRKFCDDAVAEETSPLVFSVSERQM